MRNFYNIMLLLVLGVVDAMAGTITGRVTDGQGEPLPFANVVLITARDSAFVAGVTTGDDGSFALEGNAGQLLLKVSCLGYETRVIAADAPGVGTVVLEPAATLLGEVVVQGERPVFKLTSEGLRTAVENTLLAKVGTARAVLENLPGVQTTRDAVEVFGKGTPVIYVNGRKLQNSAELDQINSEDIQHVELITNPGAKYDATVRSVILIKTRRPQGEGLSFNTRANYYAGKHPDLSLGLNWNYRHRGLDVFGTVWYNDDRSKEDDIILLDVAADTLWHMDERSNQLNHSNSMYFSLGSNYIFNDNHSVGFKYDTKAYFKDPWRGHFTADVMANGRFYDHLDNVIYTSRTVNMPHTLNAYYSGKVGVTSIDFNTDYVFNKDRSTTMNDEVSQERQSRTVTSRSVARNRLWASKLVLSWRLWGGSLLAGSEIDDTHRNDEYANPEQVVPSSRSEQREHNYIFFAEYSRPLPFGQFKVGLRNENVTTNYYDGGTRVAEQSRQYHHWFPSLGLMAGIGQVQLMANYSAKIQRPYYWQLKSSVNYANRFTLESGNPLLKPSIYHELSLMAIYRWVNVVLDYHHINDIIVNVGKEVPGNESVTWLSHDNVDHEDAIRLMVTVNPTFGPYRPSWSVGVMREWIKVPSPTGGISPDRPICLAQLNNHVQLSPTLTATAMLSFTSKGDQENLSLLRARWNLGVGLSKTLFNDRLTVEARGYNLLNSQERVKLRYGQRTLRQYQRRDSREVRLTVKYKFNAAQSKYKGTGAGADEKARL